MWIVLKPQSIEEIERHYPDQWVMLSRPQRDEQGKVISGVVLYASNDQSELYEKAKGYPSVEIVYWRRKNENSIGHSLPGGNAMLDNRSQERMPIEKIEALYPNHWILIDDPETDQYLRVVSGIVVCAGENRHSVDGYTGDLKSKSFAVHCTKKTPKDLRFLLWPFYSISKTPSSP